MHILGPDALEWMGTTYRILLGAADTGGKVAIFESVTPSGEGPPLHKHGDADEAFVVLSGDVEFWVDGTRTTCGPGQAAFVARGREHSFRVCSENPARMFTMLSPGGLEEFFREMAVAGYRLPQDMGRVLPIAGKFHLEFTGPPLSGMKTEAIGG